MAASEPLLGAFQAEGDLLIAQRLPRGVAAAAGSIALVSLLAYLIGGGSLWVWASFAVAAAGAALGLSAVLPTLCKLGWQRPAAVAAATGLAWLLFGALPASGAAAEMAVPLALCVMSAAPLALPWGARVQAFFAAATGVAALALVGWSGGDVTRLATVAIGVVAGAAISVLAAHYLELHRLAIFSDATRRESGASLEGRLLDIVERVDISLDNPSGLDAVAAAARAALGREWALILQRDERRDVARIVGGSGHSDLEIDSLRSLEFAAHEMPMLGEIIARGQLEIGDLSRSEVEVPALLKRWRCASILGAALRRGERVVGVMLVGAGRRARPLDDTGRRLFAEVARRTATAVGNFLVLADLREAGSRKSDFLATVSHELRAPLDVIVGYADMLGDPSFGELNQTQSDLLERLRAQSLNLAEFTSATLETQRLESDEVGEPLRWIDLQTLIVEMRRDARGLPRRSGVELEWDAVSKPLRLFTDPHKLRVIVKNLVGNALKFTAAGRVVACVHLDEARHRLELSVRDTGRGIERAELPHLFEMFRQGSNCAGDPEVSGVGLGLYIVKSFAEQLDGSVAAHSEPGRGSIFRVSLPLRADDKSAAARAAAKLVA